MNKEGPILCFGEIVWDALPEGIFLGGAPLNVAYHLHVLGREALPVSRVGEDFLGEETRRRLKAAGLKDSLVQSDPEQPTGAVIVELNEQGDARYDIREPAAWDFLERDEALWEAAGKAAAVVYGTLVTRSDRNAALLDELLEKVPFAVCDVNLRRPYDDRENALKWASRAAIVKMNADELAQLMPAEDPLSLQAHAARFAGETGVRTLVVTRGGEGAAVWHEGAWHEKPAPEVEVADTVGAGDAFTAAFISRLQESDSLESALGYALRIGGYVAGRRGAQPEYDPEKVAAE